MKALTIKKEEGGFGEEDSHFSLKSVCGNSI
jgi:hypothetical protein